MIAVMADDNTPPGHDAGHSLPLVRLHRYHRYTRELPSTAATPVALADLVVVVCVRWRIEEDIRAAKP
ncbi:hypothetical protein AB0D27_44760 [Streptomyces sp. NPDC048415]|jgi:hypothetical protein|uniref:hypothetical protein n=1 Tax=Streptomyces sp. NPDC048415 TaxID=3154822 RepID=UPI003423FAA3